MTPEADLIEAIDEFSALVETETRPKLQIHRDRNTSRAKRIIEKLSRKRFREQRKAVLDSHALRNLAHLKEAETEGQEHARIVNEATASLGPVILHQPVTAADSLLYDTAIRQAIDAGASGISEHLGSTAGETESFIASYLKENGFTKLTGELDKTTVDRLASAIADAYEEGADFDQTVAAVKSEFADFTAARAKMIAQTELNQAYNQSILHFGRESGATLKSWQTDLAPCPICIENALAGEIDIEDNFPSGDDAAPGHPNCLCSTLVHVV